MKTISMSYEEYQADITNAHLKGAEAVEGLFEKLNDCIRELEAALTRSDVDKVRLDLIQLAVAIKGAGKIK